MLNKTFIILVFILFSSFIYSQNKKLKKPDVAADLKIGDTTIYNIPDNYTITSVENWNTNKKVEGNVFIEPNATLNINNATIEFGPKGRIVVKNNAKINITSSILRAYKCPGEILSMWQGIELWAATSPNTTITVDNSNIEDAHIAVLIGKRNPNYPYCNPNISELYIQQYGNVDLNITNTVFKNNGVGIKYRDFITGITNISNNTFISDTLNDNMYSLTNPNHYPNTQNPWVSGANQHQRALYGINFTNKYINYNNSANKTYNNSFTNIDTCIKAIDSKLIIKGQPSFTIMQNFDYGFYAINSNSSIANYEICNYEFLKDATGTYSEPKAAIYIEAGNYDLIHDNSIGTYDQNYSYPQFTYGINLINTDNYKVYENKLYKCIVGLHADNNKYGFIGAEGPFWKGNQFNKNKIGVLTRNNNLHLQLRCNKYKPNHYGNNYIANWANVNTIYLTQGGPTLITIGKLANQGVPNNICSGYYKNRCPASNQFNEPNYKQITSTPFVGHYTYWRHNTNNNPALNFLIPTNPNNSVSVNIDSHSYWQGETQSCQPYLPFIPNNGGGTIITLPPLNFDNPPYSKIDSLETLKQNAISEKQYILDNIDNGNTEYLLNAINSNMPSYWLAGLLITNSPLSDTVLISAITRRPRLNSFAFTLVMMYNVPVSNKVYPYYIQRYNTLPYYFRNYLNYTQQNPYIQTPEIVEQKIQSYDILKSDITNRIVSVLTDTNNNRENDALLVLEHDGSINAKKTLVATYINNGNYTQANTILNQIPQNTDENIDFVQYNTLILNLYSQGKTIYDLDSTQINYIRTLAYKCPPNGSVSNAKAVLDILYNEKVPQCQIQDDLDKRMQVNNPNRNIGNDTKGTIEEIDNDESMIKDIYPNPFTNTVTIPYILPEGLTGTILIYDINGKIIEEFEAQTGENKIELNTKKWASGTYIITMKINSFVFSSRKMIKK